MNPTPRGVGRTSHPKASQFSEGPQLSSSLPGGFLGSLSNKQASFKPCCEGNPEQVTKNGVRGNRAPVPAKHLRKKGRSSALALYFSGLQGLTGINGGTKLWEEEKEAHVL